MLENSNEKQVAVKQEAGLPSDALFEADAKLGAKESDILLGLNGTLPDLFEIFKKRYKQCKSIGEDLLKSGPKIPMFEDKVKPNDPCPCGSGKKYKKCCGAC
mgnify:CR=1 FL=1